MGGLSSLENRGGAPMHPATWSDVCAKLKISDEDRTTTSNILHETFPSFGRNEEGTCKSELRHGSEFQLGVHYTAYSSRSCFLYHAASRKLARYSICLRPSGVLVDDTVSGPPGTLRPPRLWERFVIPTRPRPFGEYSISDLATPSVGQETTDSALLGVGGDGHIDTTTPSQADLQKTPKIKQHMDRAAVIIENRPLENLIPVMLHFHSVLGPEWPLIFYTIPTTSDALMASAPFSRAVDEGRITIRYLPPEVSFSNHRAVSLFLTEPWLWADLAPYDKILMFQDDSIICSASGARADDFLEYDLIGAPIAPYYGQGYNGGLSIRSRALVLDLLARFSYANDSAVPGAPANMQFEDQWLYTRMQQLPPRPDGSPAARLPSDEVAGSFAVETVWQDRPFGFHQPVRWQKDNMEKIVQYCPEVGMISGAAFF
ncbi:hypothetical protein JX265_002471 [Neoarthrinium moseri]|uniref:DUF5672 domain-containing protein n=1 Tax=Neoarthrinium moseri TaxID=1658444 RepID=A0A9P9WUI3_9PEZI|nr:hypothetical protein JX265_002471 [Neoarthrinium moseri]